MTRSGSLSSCGENAACNQHHSPLRWNIMRRKKIVGEQVTLDCGTTLTLGFVTAACEDSTTLLEVTISLFEEICDTYATSKPDAEGCALLRQLLSKLCSTMTDRVAVMKCFGKKFKDFLTTELGRDVQFHFLHCNAHFLHGLSQSCESSLKLMEEEIRKETGPLGRDSQPIFARFKSASWFNRMASEITGPRGDDEEIGLPTVVSCRWQAR